MDQEIFKLVSKEEDKIRLWQDLADTKSEILCKGKDDNLCNIKALFFNEKTKSLECRFNSSVRLVLNEEYLGYVFIGGEKYYFQAKAQFNQEYVVIPLPKELYHLQRRQNYRVHIPAGYKGSFEIFSLNSVAGKIACELADLSSQGCKLQCAASKASFKIGDEISGQLILGMRAPIEVQGIIRHVQLDALKKTQTFGVEFTSLSPILENRLFALTMEVHKEVFKRV
ncbi:MAG: PilZ domain-containing protein [Bdellovibrio sp.]|nr:PilZ domain-containing protein [Bdellovibrio sp.]